MGKFEFDIARVRSDFPILDRKVNRCPLVYLDNAATTHVPDQVLAVIANHYHTHNANVHRGAHTLSLEATGYFEKARERVAEFVGANRKSEVVFTRGTTDSINLVAQSWGAANRKSGVAVTAMEHHSNFIPWQQLCRARRKKLGVVPLDSSGDLDLDALEVMLRKDDIGLVAVTQVSNVLGTVNPLRDIVELAHRFGALVLIDAAQAVRHEAIQAHELECDFLCFSGHKMMGPTGIGVLYGKASLLEKIPPFAFGGEMADRVDAIRSTFQPAPLKFEAGTPNYVGAIGLAASIDYLKGVGLSAIRLREQELLRYAEKRIRSISEVRVLGSPKRRAGCLSFAVEGRNPFDVAAMLDAQGIAVRSGSMCAQPLVKNLDVAQVVRISPAFYNTFEELDACIAALEETVAMLPPALQG
ncbi:aminotransferase class V-fold PLP-dependent enzyme [Raoultibacter phocaeensis]|uniref:aminotransferase class V-fold PLP-dependent enzyme n=1 Tax=Raoultibacter phocaeensis TaxID=2479841 RepID=UPI0011181638|nr:cysteine desulfurase [Raoultibacter phocaeensis]